MTRPASPDAAAWAGLAACGARGEKLLVAWHQGRFQLDDDVNGYLPFRLSHPRHPDRPITFRMLLHHTSGLTDCGFGANRPACLEGRRDPETCIGAFLRSILDKNALAYSEEHFGSCPGECAEHSELGLLVLEYLGERMEALNRAIRA